MNFKKFKYINEEKTFDKNRKYFQKFKKIFCNFLFFYHFRFYFWNEIDLFVKRCQWYVMIEIKKFEKIENNSIIV